MILSEKSQQISNAFSKYVNTGNKSLIENFNLDDIEHTLLQYHADKGWAHYEAMEKRITELRQGKSEKKNKREKWIDRIIGFFVGIGIAVIGGMLLHLLTKN